MSDKLKCPLDDGILEGNADNELLCPSCGRAFPMKDVGGRAVPDLRALKHSARVEVSFTIPQEPLETGRVDGFGKSTEALFDCPSREDLRVRYGTKLQKEFLFHIQQTYESKGKESSVLDLGCGEGGNTRYLKDVGFNNVVPVDYMATGAEYLVDVHRLPFQEGEFDMILTTATLEHFYNPFLAFREMHRVLKPGGTLLASGSFWESWHAASCFHLTPGGIDQLCRFAGLELIDLWVGWGCIPSICSHAFGLKKVKRLTYMLQHAFDRLYAIRFGKTAGKQHRFRTAGSFGMAAIKMV